MCYHVFSTLLLAKISKIIVWYENLLSGMVQSANIDQLVPRQVSADWCKVPLNSQLHYLVCVCYCKCIMCSVYDIWRTFNVLLVSVDFIWWVIEIHLLKLNTIHKCFLYPYKRQILMLWLIALQGVRANGTWNIHNARKTLYIRLEIV